MIKAFRIDERLIHGQVIVAWVKSLGITHLIVANDIAATDIIQQTAMKLAVPANVKCLIESVSDTVQILRDPRCATMSIMLIVGNPDDAYVILQQIDEITEVNLANYGSIAKRDVRGKRTISNMVYLDADDVRSVNKIIAYGKPVYTQKTPSEPKKMLTKQL